jgi:hypothetical protein
VAPACAHQCCGSASPTPPCPCHCAAVSGCRAIECHRHGPRVAGKNLRDAEIQCGNLVKRFIRPCKTPCPHHPHVQQTNEASCLEVGVTVQIRQNCNGSWVCFGPLKIPKRKAVFQLQSYVGVVKIHHMFAVMKQGRGPACYGGSWSLCARRHGAGCRSSCCT